jgi:hypothetical protein
MTTAAKSSFGAKLLYGDGATPELFTAVAEQVTITPPTLTGQTANVTNHDSPLDSGGRPCEEFIPTTINPGTVQSAGNWTAAASQVIAETKLKSGAAGNWVLAWPNFGSTTVNFTFSGDQITASSHGLVTGQPVRVTSTGTLPSGVVVGTTYYVRAVDTDTIQLHATNAAAIANTGAISLTSGSGTHSVNRGSRLAFAGIVTGDGWQLDANSQQKQEFTITITGAATLTA